MYGKQDGRIIKSVRDLRSPNFVVEGLDTMNTEPVRLRDPEGTKRLVLDSAERLFSERGFAGTSIRDVALASGVSHPLIQHHFVTKEGLYRSVLRRCGEEYKIRFPEASENTDQPAVLREEMTRLFGFVRERCRLIRMVGWARLEGRDDLYCEQGKPREAMIRRIEAGQRSGSIRTDIDASTLGVMLEALLFYWIENRASIAQHSAEPIDDDAYLKKAILLFERGAASHPCKT